MIDYFCSYIVIECGLIKSYGDTIVSVYDGVDGELLKTLKEDIKNGHHKDNPDVNIVITALNRI